MKKIYRFCWLSLVLMLLTGCASDLERRATAQAATAAAVGLPVLAPLTSQPAATGPPVGTATNPTTTTTSPPATTSMVDPRYAELTAALDAAVRDFADTGRFMGAVLVAQEGQVLLSQGYGLADREAQIANTPTTRFLIGSLTKQFTAAVILQLQAAGRLSVPDPLSTYLPDYPNGTNITLHHLLSHTSGVPDHTQFPNFRQTLATPFPVDALIDTFAGAPADFAPGERFAYSNSNYVLLGKVIEVVTGQPYATVVQEQIFTRLGMADSGYGQNGGVPGQAQGYAVGGNGPRPAPYVDMSIPYAAGALYSTVEDMFRWDRALRAEQVLDPAGIELMFTPHQGNYGYGWYVRETATGREAWHGGSIYGYRSYILRGIDDDFLIIVLSNLDAAPMPDIATALKTVLDSP